MIYNLKQIWRCKIKWYKHISDSLNDPDIHYLIEKHGSNGYLVFFGILEIYAREFKPEPNWKLEVTLSYLKQNLYQSHYKHMLDCFQTISGLGRFNIELSENSARTLVELSENSARTLVELSENSARTLVELCSNFTRTCSELTKKHTTLNNVEVSIFIPKFKDIMDEWTLRKLGGNSGVTPKILRHEEEVRCKIKEEDKEKDIKIKENIKEKDITVYKTIINYLNEKTGKKFSPSGKHTQELINARIEEGFTPEDFFKVIDNKCAEWNKEPEQGKQDMRQYLQPSTLFSITHFEEYLNHGGNKSGSPKKEVSIKDKDYYDGMPENMSHT